MNLENYISIQNRLIDTIPLTFKRSLYHQIPWEKRLIGIYGPRGVGKTTLLLQHCIEQLHSEEYLYVSADNPLVLRDGLYAIGDSFFKYGGKVFVVDEVHRMDQWATEIKALYDAFPQKQIIFSGSSSFKLLGGNTDLSRRVLFFKMDVLSFREFLNFRSGTNFGEISLEELINKHVAMAKEVQKYEPLKHYVAYLKMGCFPTQEKEAYFYSRLINIIDKSLTEDIPGDISINNVSILKKIIAFLATSTVPKVSPTNLSKELTISKNTLYAYLDLLEKSGLIRKYLPHGAGKRKLRSGEKVFLSSPNFYYALYHSQWQSNSNSGTIREAFFSSQADFLGLEIPSKADFVVNNHIFFEIGGPSKTEKQIASLENGYLLKDGIEIGFGKHIPLFLAGFLR